MSDINTNTSNKYETRRELKTTFSDIGETIMSSINELI